MIWQFDRFGNVYVSDHLTQDLHVFAKNASQWAQIRREGFVQFNDIYSVAVDNKGYVYVSDPAVEILMVDGPRSPPGIAREGGAGDGGDPAREFRRRSRTARPARR